MSTCAPDVKDGLSFPLWMPMTPEGDNKECVVNDPVNSAMEYLEDYGATWLNDSINTGGILRIGVSNMPPLTVGVWLDKRCCVVFDTTTCKAV